MNGGYILIGSIFPFYNGDPWNWDSPFMFKRHATMCTVGWDHVMNGCNTDEDLRHFCGAVQKREKNSRLTSVCLASNETAVYDRSFLLL